MQAKAFNFLLGMLHMYEILCFGNKEEKDLCFEQCGLLFVCVLFPKLNKQKNIRKHKTLLTKKIKFSINEKSCFLLKKIVDYVLGDKEKPLEC